MDTDRTYANIARRVVDPADDGQNLQQFMTDSPWSAQAVIEKVQHELAATPALQSGGVLILDESAEEKAGNHTVGAAPQYNGRLGKIAMSQVGVFLAFAKGSFWTWVAGTLFLPEVWFTPACAAERHRLGIPLTRTFQTKIVLGWHLIQQVVAAAIPFDVILCDDFYGRSSWLRAQIDQAGLLYLADIPKNTTVYLAQPIVGVPVARGRRGRRATKPQVLNGVTPHAVSAVAQRSDTVWKTLVVRETERGHLEDAFAVRRVWVLEEDTVAEVWLVIRQETPAKWTYALSNAARTSCEETLIEQKCLRYGIECANREAKSELGFDTLQAQKYQAWDHHLALTILATWFLVQTRLAWTETYARDATLTEQLAVVQLPALSVANVRELLQAVLPLHQLSPEQALRLVVQMLINRARSTASRLKTQEQRRCPT
jgi:SRSO17 transposase